MKQKKISDKYLEKRVVTAAGRKDNFLVGTYTVFYEANESRMHFAAVLDEISSRLAVFFCLFGQVSSSKWQIDNCSISVFDRNDFWVDACPLTVHHSSRIAVMAFEFSLVLGLVLDRSTTMWFRLDKDARCV